MKSKKKFLIFAVILNIIFFAGVSFWVQHQMTTNPLILWLAHGSKNLNSQLQGDISEMRSLAQRLLNVTSLDKKKEIIASGGDIETALEVEDEKILEIQGQRKSFPFPQSLFSSNGIGFYHRENNLFWTYFINHPDSDRKINTIVTIHRPKRFLDKLLLFGGMNLAVVEQDHETSRVLYTNLNDSEAQDLLHQVSMNDVGLAVTSSKTKLAKNVFYVSLQRQKHLAVMINLSHTDTFKQKLVYMIRDPDYQGLSLSQLHLAIWTLFCISLGLTFLILQKSVDENGL